jgi:CheY-like chemotaxis protein
LRRWGIETASAESGPAALALHRHGLDFAQFDLMLLDRQMPGMDGFELAAQVRALPGLETMIILILTSTGPFGDAARAREMGLGGYLVKPVSRGELQQALLDALRVPAPMTETGSAAASSAVRPIDPLTILLVEDNAVNRRVAAGVLSRRGHTIVPAEDGREAVALFGQRRVEVVLMDVQMPVMGGYEATALIRKLELERGMTRTPIIALTAHALTGDAERCLSAGMDGYLSKPFTAQELIEIVERLGNSRRSAEEHRDVLPPRAAA